MEFILCWVYASSIYAIIFSLAFFLITYNTLIKYQATIKCPTVNVQAKSD